MGKKFTVTPEELESASKKLQQTSESYTEIYKQLLTNAETMGEAWQGEDNLKFVQQIKGLTDDLQNMATKLSDASQTLMKQKEAYVQQQQVNIAAINKLQN